MLGKLVKGSLLKNIGITLWTLVTLTTSAALVAMVLTVYLNVEKKMGGVLRRLGPNAVASFNFSGEDKPAANWRKFDELIKERGIAMAGLAFDIVTLDRRPVVLVRSEPEKLRDMTPYWVISGRRAEHEGQCLIGKRLAEAFKLKPGMSVQFQSPDMPDMKASVAGVFISGDENEDRIFIPPILSGRQPRLGQIGAGQPPAGHNQLTTALLSIPEGEEGLERLRQKLGEEGIGIEVRPLREIIHGEKMTLKKIVLLCSVTLFAVLALTILGVSSALLARMVERRKEFALLQAIGARGRSLAGFLLFEGAVTGTLASVAGFIIGSFAAGLVVRQIFSASVALQAAAFPVTLFATLAVSLAASGMGLARVLRMETASALRGE